MLKVILRVFLINIISTFILEGQIWQWATSSYNGFSNRAMDVCSDKNGNVIITGYYDDPIVSFGTYTLSNLSGNSEVFICKYDPNGNVLWAKTSAGSNLNCGTSISCDSIGNIFLSGTYSSPVFVLGSFTLTNSGGVKPFIAKLDPSGNILWLKGGVGNIDGNPSIATERNGNTYMIGTFDSPTMTFGSFVLNNTNNFQEMFLVKYDSNGNVNWATKAGGIGYDYGTAVSLDSIGNIYVAGNFYSSSITFGTNTLMNSGLGDFYIAKYNSNGTAIWAKKANCIGNDLANAISTDKHGNSYLAGIFTHSVLVFNTYTLTNNSFQNNFFLSKFDSLGNIVWAKAASSYTFSNQKCTSVYADLENIYIAGSFNTKISLDTYTLYAPSSPSLDPMYIAKISKNGSVISALALSSGGSASGPCITAVDSCNLLLGSGYSAGYPFALGSYTLPGNGGLVTFLAKLDCSNVTTGLNQNFKTNPVNLFPNPASNTFTLSSNHLHQITEIKILDLNGKVICDRDFATQSKEIRIDINLENGVYLVKISNALNEFKICKLIVAN